MRIGRDRGYGVDKEDLKHKFRELQRVLHPDRFSAGGAAAEAAAQAVSSAVNKAYATLKVCAR